MLVVPGDTGRSMGVPRVQIEISSGLLEQVCEGNWLVPNDVCKTSFHLDQKGSRRQVELNVI